MAEPRRLRINPLMERQENSDDMRRRVIAQQTGKQNYREAYQMYEWGREYFCYGETDRDVKNRMRLVHYTRMGDFFVTITTNPLAIRRFTGQPVSKFYELCRHPLVIRFLREVCRAYWAGSPLYYPEVPITPKVILVMAMHYLDQGKSFKDVGNLFQIPKVSFLVRQGLKAIVKVDNIKMPISEAHYITSMLGYTQTHGFPNGGLSLDVTPIFGMVRAKQRKCPETNRHCLKVANAVDSSGRFCSLHIADGSLIESEIFSQWSLFKRLKATEVHIGLPGNNPHWVPTAEYPPLEGYPVRVRFPMNEDGINPDLDSTAMGVYVDDRHSTQECALFLTPRAGGFDARSSLRYNQGHFRTRMSHERLHGRFSNYFHIKLRPSPMEPANHPIMDAIPAAMSIINLGGPNPEHACTR